MISTQTSQPQRALSQARDHESFFPVLEHIDRICARTFERSASLDKDVRFTIYLRLLDSFGHETPGFGDGDRGKVCGFMLEDESVLMREILPRLAKPTYMVTSYWSPLDERRHSVYHRAELDSLNRRRAIANAFTFYALTFTGSPATGGYEKEYLYSATQFIARHAERKMSFPLCFENDLPKGGDDWWHIPESLHQGLLDETGVGASIEQRLVQNSKLSTEAIEAALRSTLMNSASGGWETLDNFAGLVIAEFRSRLKGLSQPVRSLAEGTAKILGELFRHEITPEQALFMVLTHVVWRHACPDTSYAYTFPARVEATCCVFTIGTRTPLKRPQLGFLACLSKALFVHPLIQDYSLKATAQKAQFMAHTKQNAFRKLIGHNLPKFLIKPTVGKLKDLRAVLERERKKGGGRSENLAGAVSAIEDLKFLLDHYDSFLHAFASADRLREMIAHEPGTPLVNLNELADLIKRVFYSIIVERFTLKEKRNLLKLEWDVPVNGSLYCDMTLLKEALFNLLSNAVEALNPPDVTEENGRGVVRVKVAHRDGDDMTAISVIDCGAGFLPDKLVDVQTKLGQLWAGDENAFWDTTDRLIESAFNEEQCEDNMGVGLIFCAVFLRRLEWASPFHRAGSLEIEAREGGTTITMCIPG